MQVLELGKLRFQTRGQWDPELEYEFNDVVGYGGNLYVYFYPLKEAGHLPTNTARFALMLAGTVHKGALVTTQAYRIGESVSYGSGVFRASEDIAAGVTPDTAPQLWLKISESPSYRGDWATNADYRKGELVTYGASTMSCLVSHKAGVFDTDKAAGKWAVFLSGVRYRGMYAPGTTYATDDLVSDGLHMRAAKHLIENAPALLVAADWEIVVRGADYLPSQLGQAGKTLGTDGVNPLWVNANLFDNMTMLAQFQAAALSL